MGSHHSKLAHTHTHTNHSAEPIDHNLFIKCVNVESICAGWKIVENTLSSKCYVFISIYTRIPCRVGHSGNVTVSTRSSVFCQRTPTMTFIMKYCLVYNVIMFIRYRKLPHSFFSLSFMRGTMLVLRNLLKMLSRRFRLLDYCEHTPPLTRIYTAMKYSFSNDINYRWRSQFDFVVTHFVACIQKSIFIRFTWESNYKLKFLWESRQKKTCVQNIDRKKSIRMTWENQPNSMHKTKNLRC